MRIKGHQIIVVIILLSSLLAGPRISLGCGPFSLEATFTYTKHPDFPLQLFARGELGVLRPTYARSYLYSSYRHLAGTGFNRPEQNSLVELWRQRLDFDGKPRDEDWTKNWLGARGRVAGIDPPPEISAYRSREKPNEYETYLNCTDDAFQNAIQVLNERVKRFGAESSEVKEWVRAQDQVFANCSAGQHIPDPAPAGADPLVRADRTYQIAAANFYATNFDEARRLFDRIGADASSPYRPTAPYLIARTLIRKASLGPQESKTESLQEAETQLNRVLNDQGRAALHPAAQRLLKLVALRLHPEARLHELAHDLLKRDSSETLKQNLWDYTVLLDNFIGDDEGEAKNVPKTRPALGKGDDLTDWIINFQAAGKEAQDHALQRWQQTGSLPWLVAAITKAEANHSQAASLLSAAGKVRRNSPAFPSLAFHSVRLLLESGRKDEARERLDSMLAQDRAAFPASSLNLLLGRRMTLARNLEEFLKYAQRSPSGFSYNMDGRQIPEDVEKGDELKAYRGMKVLLDVDSARILNEKMPLSLLEAAAAGSALDARLRREVAQAAWVRAALLDESETARELVPVVLGLSPELGEMLNVYMNAPSAEARRYAALFTFLRFPGLNPYIEANIGRTTPLPEIDSYRDNWWCATEPYAPPSDQESKGEKKGEQKGASDEAAGLKSPDFLNDEQRAAAEKEVARLSALGTAPNYLCSQAIEWAKASPHDPRVPEALHLAVKSTRYGCADKGTGALSKAAFQILHKQYPKSEWAAKTKYWYKD